MVKKIVEKHELFMCHKHLPEDVDTVGFYFVRVQTDPIKGPSSLDQANSILPECFETGTIGHTPLNALERALTYVYMPMLMIQGSINNLSSI